MYIDVMSMVKISLSWPEKLKSRKICSACVLSLMYITYIKTVHTHYKFSAISISPAKANLFSQFVPSLALANVMSLAPKIDEVRVFLSDYRLDLFCITETWLKESIDDSVVDINGYNIVRRDRLYSQHGGVCLYINEAIKFLALRQFENSEPGGAEVLWVKLTPHRLPRGYNCITRPSVRVHWVACGRCTVPDNFFHGH